MLLTESLNLLTSLGQHERSGKQFVAARIPDLMNHDERGCAVDNLYFSVDSNEKTQ